MWTERREIGLLPCAIACHAHILSEKTGLAKGRGDEPNCRVGVSAANHHRSAVNRRVEERISGNKRRVVDPNAERPDVVVDSSTTVNSTAVNEAATFGVPTNKRIGTRGQDSLYDISRQRETGV